MRGKIALAIITKNRPQKLERCLDSIAKQSLSPDEIIIVDNDPDLSAKKVSQNKKYHPLKISYFAGKGSVPHCRNLALTKVKVTYLAFVDDDCVLRNTWLENALDNISKQKSDYVLGKTLLLNPNNIFALSQYAHDEYWKNYSEQIFDTKNVFLNLSKIKKYKLKFDEKCQKKHYDSADFDFDFQVKRNKLHGSFSEKMTLFHQETESFTRFIKRAYARGYLAKYLNDKWELNDRLVDFDQKNPMIWLLKMIKNYPKDYVKYSPHMNRESAIKKTFAILFIKIFEYCYTLGYVAKRT